jgi:hypothetical protein
MKVALALFLMSLLCTVVRNQQLPLGSLLAFCKGTAWAETFLKRRMGNDKLIWVLWESGRGQL